MLAIEQPRTLSTQISSSRTSSCPVHRAPDVLHVRNNEFITETAVSEDLPFRETLLRKRWLVGKGRVLGLLDIHIAPDFLRATIEIVCRLEEKYLNALAQLFAFGSWGLIVLRQDDWKVPYFASDQQSLWAPIHILPFHLNFCSKI